jgi:hypothetical protein
VASIAPCAGTSGEFSASPAGPFTVIANATDQKIGTTQSVSLIYRPVDSGTDSGCLEISTDDPYAPVLNVDVTGSGFVPLPVLDLDIAGFTVTPSVTLRSKASIAIQLFVLNPGTVTGSATATVTGARNGVQVYSRSLSVSDTTGDSTPTVFTFPAYKPTQAGTITWTATIADSDSDIDSANASTAVTR